MTDPMDEIDHAFADRRRVVDLIRGNWKETSAQIFAQMICSFSATLAVFIALNATTRWQDRTLYWLTGLGGLVFIVGCLASFSVRRRITRSRAERLMVADDLIISLLVGQAARLRAYQNAHGPLTPDQDLVARGEANWGHAKVVAEGAEG